MPEEDTRLGGWNRYPEPPGPKARTMTRPTARAASPGASKPGARLGIADRPGHFGRHVLLSQER